MNKDKQIIIMMNTIKMLQQASGEVQASLCNRHDEFHCGGFQCHECLLNIDVANEFANALPVESLVKTGGCDE